MDVWPSVLANHNWATTFSADLPAVNGVGLGGEVDAEFDDLLAGGEERLVVAFFLYLLEGDFRRLVALELDDIDIFVGVENDVYAAARCVILGLDIESHHLEHHRHRVLEVEFEVSLDFVVVAGEEGCEAGHEGIYVAAFDVIDKTINRELVANKGRSIKLTE